VLQSTTTRLQHIAVLPSIASDLSLLPLLLPLLLLLLLYW
jgi:hypothetical protein